MLLIGVSDSSYKEDFATATFFLAKRGKADILVQCTAVVSGDKKMLSPYCAELYGMLAMIKTTERFAAQNVEPSGMVSIGFDNLTGYQYIKGIYSCSPACADFDLVCAICEVIRISNLTWELFWVKGRQDDYKTELTQKEALNVASDSLAKTLQVTCWRKNVGRLKSIRHIPTHTRCFRQKQ